MTTQELIQIETASMATNNGLDYMFQVVINQQDTPAISLDGLRFFLCFLADKYKNPYLCGRKHFLI